MNASLGLAGATYMKRLTQRCAAALGLGSVLFAVVMANATAMRTDPEGVEEDPGFTPAIPPDVLQSSHTIAALLGNEVDADGVLLDNDYLREPEPASRVTRLLTGALVATESYIDD
ncbi:MAG: hypothetical protein IPH13_08855 [Planctomycetes bacterium]|nr:hypothetical protein [Planctomycetota bacterium]